MGQAMTRITPEIALENARDVLRDFSKTDIDFASKLSDLTATELVRTVRWAAEEDAQEIRDLAERQPAVWLGRLSAALVKLVESLDA